MTSVCLFSEEASLVPWTPFQYMWEEEHFKNNKVYSNWISEFKNKCDVFHWHTSLPYLFIISFNKLPGFHLYLFRDFGAELSG